MFRWLEPKQHSFPAQVSLSPFLNRDPAAFTGTQPMWWDFVFSTLTQAFPCLLWGSESFSRSEPNTQPLRMKRYFFLVTHLCHGNGHNDCQSNGEVLVRAFNVLIKCILHGDGAETTCDTDSRIGLDKQTHRWQKGKEGTGQGIDYKIHRRCNVWCLKILRITYLKNNLWKLIHTPQMLSVTMPTADLCALLNNFILETISLLIFKLFPENLFSNLLWRN